MKEFLFRLLVVVGFISYIVFGAIITSIVYQVKIETLENELEFYKDCSLREAEILFIDNEGDFVVVYDEYLEYFIEIDVFPEIIHCTIEVGDTALYVINMEATDADLLGIIKKE